MFTEAEWQILKKYEDRFYSAIYCQYIRAIWKSDIEKLLPIYERVTEKKYSMCINCPSSKLKFMELLGKIYFKQKNNEEKTIDKNGTDKSNKKMERTAKAKGRTKKKDS